MSAQAEVAVTAQREIRKNLRSAKGIAMFVLFVLGGLIPRLISLLLQRYAKEAGLEQIPDEAIREGYLKMLSSQYGDAMGQFLVDCPKMLYGLFQGTLLFLPIVVLMVGFDTIAGETQHRTLRYYTPRAQRSSLAIGKSLGVWGVAALMLFVLHGTTWVLTLIEGKTSATLVLSWGLRLWLYATVYAAAYVGLTTLMSAIFRTPVVALFVGVGAWVIMGILRFSFEYAESTKPLTWAFPGAYEKWLLSNDVTHVLGGCAVLLAWGAVCALAATEILRRRDI